MEASDIAVFVIILLLIYLFASLAYIYSLTNIVIDLQKNVVDVDWLNANYQEIAKTSKKPFYLCSINGRLHIVPIQPDGNHAKQP